MSNRSSSPSSSSPSSGPASATPTTKATASAAAGAAAAPAARPRRAHTGLGPGEVRGAGQDAAAGAGAVGVGEPGGAGEAHQAATAILRTYGKATREGGGEGSGSRRFGSGRLSQQAWQGSWPGCSSSRGFRARSAPAGPPRKGVSARADGGASGGNSAGAAHSRPSPGRARLPRAPQAPHRRGGADGRTRRRRARAPAGGSRGRRGCWIGRLAHGPRPPRGGAAKVAGQTPRTPSLGAGSPGAAPPVWAPPSRRRACAGARSWAAGHGGKGGQRAPADPEEVEGGGAGSPSRLVEEALAQLKAEARTEEPSAGGRSEGQWCRGHGVGRGHVRISDDCPLARKCAGEHIKDGTWFPLSLTVGACRARRGRAGQICGARRRSAVGLPLVGSSRQRLHEPHRDREDYLAESAIVVLSGAHLRTTQRSSTGTTR